MHAAHAPLEERTVDGSNGLECGAAAQGGAQRGAQGGAQRAAQTGWGAARASSYTARRGCQAADRARGTAGRRRARASCIAADIRLSEMQPTALSGAGGRGRATGERDGQNRPPARDRAHRRHAVRERVEHDHQRWRKRLPCLDLHYRDGGNKPRGAGPRLRAALLSAAQRTPHSRKLVGEAVGSADGAAKVAATPPEVARRGPQGGEAQQLALARGRVVGLGRAYRIAYRRAQQRAERAIDLPSGAEDSPLWRKPTTSTPARLGRD